MPYAGILGYLEDDAAKRSARIRLAVEVAGRIAEQTTDGIEAVDLILFGEYVDFCFRPRAAGGRREFKDNAAARAIAT